MKDFIEAGKAVMGIEFGSTRIKAVLVDDGFKVIAQGAHDWENKLVDGVWSYSLEDVEAGVRDAYAKCVADAAAKYGAHLTKLAALGVSGMMHGYLPFDEKGGLLVPFRTWRNVMTAEAAAELSSLFKFNVPQRWSIAHYYQAILKNEPHVKSVRWLTTLAGYVHYRLTGENVMGVGEAKENVKVLESAVRDMEIIAGQKAVITKSKKSIANFKIRENMPIGCKVTLRGEKMYEFADRLINLALPRVRDFRGVNPNAFDGRGNYSLGIKEQLIFPEIEYDKVDKVRGMDVVFVTTANTDEEARYLLTLFNMPFAK